MFFKLLKDALKVKNVRNKILFTIFIIFVFRVGTHVTVPGINAESLKQLSDLPFLNMLNLVSGNAMGLFSAFIEDPCEMYGVEPGGTGTKLGEHAASLTYGTEGILHGFNSIMLKNEKGEPAAVHSIASGLDYPSVGPEHAYLNSISRTKVGIANDKETIQAFYDLSHYEGIIPALESAHAVAFAMKLAKEKPYESILVNLSGRGDKDIDFVVEHYKPEDYL